MSDSQAESEGLDDWEDLMPDDRDSWLSPAVKAFDLALYAQPWEFTIGEGFAYGIGLMVIPAFVLMVVATAYQLLTGHLTLHGLIVAFQTAPATSPTSLTPQQFIKQIGQAMLTTAINLPIAIGIALLTKTLLKFIGLVQGGQNE